jgi:sulfide:quinone oxidoreductase
VKPNIFVIGDATDVPASKAGSVTHFEGEVLVENVEAVPRRRAELEPPTTATPTASSRPASARRCSSTSTTRPSRCPGTSRPVGLPLLKESRLNHLGKLMFQWFYWHGLLPGRDIPGIGADMPTAARRPTHGAHRGGGHMSTKTPSPAPTSS